MRLTLRGFNYSFSLFFHGSQAKLARLQRGEITTKGTYYRKFGNRYNFNLKLELKIAYFSYLIGYNLSNAELTKVVNVAGEKIDSDYYLAQILQKNHVKLTERRRNKNKTGTCGKGKMYV